MFMGMNHKERVFKIINEECKKEGMTPDDLMTKTNNVREMSRAGRVHKRLMEISPTFFCVTLQEELLGISDKLIRYRMDIS